MLLLGDQGGEGGALVNRLVFAHLIGAFEAFLADMLIRYITNTPPALARLIEHDKELTELRFSLADIGANPELIRDTVRARLRRQIWHNIKQVSALYKKAFEIDLLAMLSNEATTLDEAIQYQHDCVHRNGFDKDGTKLNLFTEDYIRKIHGVIANLALEIIGQFALIDAAEFFISKEPKAAPSN